MSLVDASGRYLRAVREFSGREFDLQAGLALRRALDDVTAAFAENVPDEHLACAVECYLHALSASSGMPSNLDQDNGHHG